MTEFRLILTCDHVTFPGSCPDFSNDPSVRASILALKSIALNTGGSVGGRCEINKDTECIWQSIHDRLGSFDRQSQMEVIAPIRDWSASGHGGPRKIVRADLTIA